jgi:nucleotide-binding universal stress UspA family protein
MNEIIVGVDGSAAAIQTASHAAAIAAQHQRPLHLVMAVNHPRSFAMSGGAEHWQIDSLSSADQTLRAIAGAIHATTPVTHSVVVARRTTALRQEANRLEATMVVVSGPARRLARRLRSASREFAHRNPCTLVVVNAMAAA